MRAVRGVKYGFRKVQFSRVTQPLPLETFVLVKTKTGDEIVVWNSVPYTDSGKQEAWLLDTKPHGEHFTNDTRPIPTEPISKVQEDEERIQYQRRCNCGLVTGEWCNCPGDMN